MTQGAGSGKGSFGGGRGGRNAYEGETNKVVDFNLIREQRLEEKRRRTERIFFKNLVSVYSMIANSKMSPVDLIDVSEDGCSFQLPFDITNPKPWPDHAGGIPLRLYFSQDTYLEIFVKINNSRTVYENETRYLRYGCALDKELTSYPAWVQFIKFLKAYAEHAHIDSAGRHVSV